MDQLNYPWEIKPVSKEESAEINKYQYGAPIDFLRVGPNGFLLFPDFMKTGPEVYNMELRSNDVFVATFPKSGTTWTQELVWLIGNDLDYKRAAEVKLPDRFPYMEFLLFYNMKKHEMMENSPQGPEHAGSDSITDLIFKAPSPRFIKTHLAMSLLPPTILDTAKVIYVARDPRDVAVSYYHHYQLFQMFGFTGDFKTFWNLFLEAKVGNAPYFPHIMEAWEKRNHPNMLFLFYEELSKVPLILRGNKFAKIIDIHDRQKNKDEFVWGDLPAAVRRVAQFLNKSVTEEQVLRLCDHLHIDNFRQNKSVNYDHMKEIGMFNQKSSFIRKGKTGEWCAYFDEEMATQAECWIKDNLHGTDFSFPQ